MHVYNVQPRTAEHPNLREFSMSYNELRLILDSAVKYKPAGVRTVFLEQGHMAGVQGCYVSGTDRQICVDNSAHWHLWPCNYPVKFQTAQKSMEEKNI